ncbi:hypothetical protein GSI_14899 [Ganoderma sinense ZZ0214-1]|uniref:F-box domain-containing protein n=1 Tax=Ganoderma sinense ZZ0214-1 TaxID=1077348 RepID=A0A2G8RQ05_9APHY|nr:hypothetical protein GSI_14899 [Ganoderma sinense ZZ0214-1]
MGDIHPLASVRVLTNADLLHGIFTFVPRASEKRDSHLARCATVCRAFHEPTIRVLWRDLDSLLPLWHLLAPPNTLFPSDDAVEEQIQHFLEAVASAQLYLDPTRWDRFLRHAAHIRVICHRTRASPAIETANRLLIQAVIMQNAGRTVLPLLRSIHWQSCDSPWDGALIPLFTPTLRHAGFTTNSGDGPSAHLLRRLREACPTLHSIYLNYISPSLVQGVLPFDRLRKVGIYRISGPDHFRDIITKPDLTTLRVHDVVGP